MIGWYLSHGYIRGLIKETNKDIAMHRYLLHAKDYEIVDHINNNEIDNRIENLRISTSTYNNHNRKKKDNCTSIYKGVHADKNNRFYATIKKDNKKYNLGSYNNEIIAALAYNLKAEELYNNFKSINVLELTPNEYNEYKNIITAKKVNKNKFNGVTKLNIDNKWQSCIYKDNTKYYLGQYDNKLQAALAYNLKALELYDSDYNKLNTIDLDINSESYKKLKEEIYKKWKILDNKQDITNLYRGVSKPTKSDKWVAQIKKDKKDYYLGCFETDLQAAVAYNLKAIELYGENYLYLNKINIDKNSQEYKDILDIIYSKELKYNGVTKRTGRKYWTAKISINKQVVCLGQFENKIHAVIAYNLKIIELYGKSHKKFNKIDIDIDSDIYKQIKKDLIEKNLLKE
jgi:hypothetical protein